MSLLFLHILCPLSLLCSLSHGINVHCDKAVWRMWFNWILMLAHSYCLKKKAFLEIPASGRLHMHTVQRNKKNPLLSLLFLYLWAVFLNHLWACMISGGKVTAFENFLKSFMTHRSFLLCCASHVKRHYVDWASSLTSRLEAYGPSTMHTN